MDQIIEKLLAGLSTALLLAVGVAYGVMKAEIAAIKKVVFNGKFITKDEVQVRIEDADKIHDKLDERLTYLERNVVMKEE